MQSLGAALAPVGILLETAREILAMTPIDSQAFTVRGRGAFVFIDNNLQQAGDKQV